MASLKEIRTRINSVKSTRQVTSAMKMVSAAKLKKAQTQVENVRPYVGKLLEITNFLGNSVDDVQNISPGFKQRKQGKTLVLAIASNKGLAGAFNSNIVKEVERLVRNDLKEDYKSGNIIIQVVGKQLTKGLRARKINVDAEFNEVLDNPTRENVYAISEKVFSDFTAGEYRKVILIYNKFVNPAVQNVTAIQMLPVSLDAPSGAESGTKGGAKNQQPTQEHNLDFIVEPTKTEVFNALIPQLINARFLATFLESQASEHGARMTSMNKATDNATELLGELNLLYNKARQGAITNELIEIVSGAEAQKG